MDSKKIEELEQQFDKELTEGEAAEIANEQIIHQDDEALYENPEQLNNIQINGVRNRIF